MSVAAGASHDPYASADFVVRGKPSVVASGRDGSADFIDRREGADAANASNVSSSAERRQFGSSHIGLSEPGRELAAAIDRYKLQHHRRYITCDEMLTVLASLGYQRAINA